MLAANVDGDAIPPQSVVGDGVPWSGSEFGVDDLAWLASRRRPLLIAPVGAHNTGKTTFLASLYIGLFRGVLPQSHQFVGSYTLGGWEKIASYMRHSPDGLGPGFPPHTPVTAKREPGWLHIGLRDGDERIRDVLVADAPGEWFSRWAIRKSDETAEGARWIANHADAFLFFLDCDGLAGPDRRNVADQSELLAKRLAEELRRRPVVAVWAKSDKSIPKTLRDDVESAIKDAFADQEHFRTSVHGNDPSVEPTRQFWNVIDCCLQRGVPRHTLQTIESLAPSNPFLSFRG